MLSSINLDARNLITVRKADRKDVQSLSEKLSALLEDKTSQVYQDNVAKFGIPQEYVKKAFAKETLLKAVDTGKVTFYLAFRGNELIGFAQTIRQSIDIVELDRIVVFPEHARKGVGTLLLNEVIKDQKQEGVKSITVNAEKGEIHAKRFYEKTGFKQIKEAAIDTPWGKKLTLVTYQLCLEP